MRRQWTAVQFRNRNSAQPSFHTSIGPAVLVGTVACSLFYGLIYAGPLDYAMIRRYCLCHPVAIATTELFLVAFVALSVKWYQVRWQRALCKRGCDSLDEISLNQNDLPEDATGVQKAQWFDTLWKTQGRQICDSWLGQRVTATLQRQLKRKNTKHLDDDIQELAERDADQQHDSYGLIRIVTWAMPMLGFLGTVLGISDTLGMMDAQALASGSQDAMNSLTAGLYVAFDTTAIGLVLTMVAMFIQFFVNRSELSILGLMDAKVSEALRLCLTEQDTPPVSSNLESSLRTVSNELIQAVQSMVEKQVELWQQTIGNAHGHWQNLTSKSADTLQFALAGAIEGAMIKHATSVAAHAEQITRIQSDGAAQIDSRWQQWQTTLSEQTRAIHHQQLQMNQQTELLSKLIEKHEAIREMEPPLQKVLDQLTEIDHTTLERFTNVERFHDVAVCMTEAIAVLGTQLERHGFLGKQPVRRRSEVPSSAEAPDMDNLDSSENSTEPTTIPIAAAKTWKRQAG
jgi:biopolymer transport protein ExbB/TolQ